MIAILKALLARLFDWLALYCAGYAAGRQGETLKAQRQTGLTLQTRTEVDHVVQEAAAGGSAGLADLARSSGLMRPGDK